MREPDGEQRYIKKVLDGALPLHETLKDCPHPYLPKIYEVSIQNGVTIILEEYIEGDTIAKAPLSEKALCNAMKELCAALQFLHNKGIVHRDIKPSNIILAEDGHIRLIDFDAARLMKDVGDQDTRLLGTRGFAPPEQYGFAQTDTRADVYSLGITFKELLGDKANRPRYRRIISKCTDLNPDKRYQSASAVKKALMFSRRYLAYAAIAVAGILLAAGIMYGLPKQNNPLPQSEAYYNNSELLFNAEGSEYIILTSAEMSEDGTYAHMQVDMTGNGNFVDFMLPQSLNNWVEFGEKFDMSFYLDDLADGIQASFWHDGTEASLWASGIDTLYRSIPYDSLNLSDETTSQITCVDADGDGVKELFVTQGDGKSALLTT
ncbi:serine/threonine protein kinase, partial [Ruminococcaceae bacterium OttesenSCG-928-L11]|nr:serine/threonine protein kinase [Ruminococcaceae bacterium OttesenSCG-928-L11]